MDDMPDWVFAYGSLLWDPGFQPAETRPGVLRGYKRSFCMWSIHHRGSQTSPGLVLALDELDEAECTGLAMRIAPEDKANVLAMLRERELISSAYREEKVRIALDDGATIDGFSYIIQQDHVQYCGDLSLERQAEVIAGAVGGRGPNHEYLDRTMAKFRALGIEDQDLSWLQERVAEIRAESQSS